MSWKTEVFRPELDRIHSKEIREAGEYLIENIIPDRFFVIPSSSSGKYHPECSNGRGGLVIHTKRLVFLAIQLAEGAKVPQKDIDILIVAGIMHDTAKKKNYTKEDKDGYVNHPIIAVNMVKEAEEKIIDYIPRPSLNMMYNLIQYHMGVFTPDSFAKKFSKYTILEQIIYFADYLSSRKMIDLPVDTFKVEVPEEIEPE